METILKESNVGTSQADVNRDLVQSEPQTGQGSKLSVLSPSFPPWKLVF